MSRRRRSCAEISVVDLTFSSKRSLTCFVSCVTTSSFDIPNLKPAISSPSTFLCSAETGGAGFFFTGGGAFGFAAVGVFAAGAGFFASPPKATEDTSGEDIITAVNRTFLMWNRCIRPLCGSENTHASMTSQGRRASASCDSTVAMLVEPDDAAADPRADAYAIPADAQRGSGQIAHRADARPSR